jgi:hypothetical protein
MVLINVIHYNYPKMLYAIKIVLTIGEHFLKILTVTILSVFVSYSLDPVLRHLQSNSQKMSLAIVYFSNICLFKYLLSSVLFCIFLVKH